LLGLSDGHQDSAVMGQCLRVVDHPLVAQDVRDIRQASSGSRAGSIIRPIPRGTQYFRIPPTIPRAPSHGESAVHEFPTLAGTMTSPLCDLRTMATLLRNYLPALVDLAAERWALSRAPPGSVLPEASGLSSQRDLAGGWQPISRPAASLPSSASSRSPMSQQT
jgi:hypothetical protein